MTWEALEEACRACQKCPLSATRHNVVFGVGPRTAEILLVGEGPGENEDRQGEPFVGRAGKLLDDMLEIIGLSRAKNVFIANIVKCRPPGNRDPEPSEQAACIGYLEEQIALLKPKLVICLGRIAAGVLIRPDYRITREHGQWTIRDGVRYTALYHPAALLRDPRKKPETFEDLMRIRETIREVCPATAAGADFL